MRLNIPRVHGDTPKEKAIRSLLLVLIFAAVVWAFMENNKRVVDRLNRESAVYDETKRLDNDQKKFIVSFTKSLREEFGLESQIQIFGGDFVVPELDNKTLYIGIAPPIKEVEIRFPPIVKQAVGTEFIEMLRTDHFLPSFENDDWPQELQIVLATIFNKLTELEQGENAGE